MTLHSRFSRIVFLLLVLAGGLSLTLLAARVVIAQELARSNDISNLMWSLRLDENNAAIHDRLGLAYQWNLNDSSSAIRHLRRATVLNPYQAAYWVDLGNGCELAGDLDCAVHAFASAVRLAPQRPDFEWNKANLDLRIGSSDQALKDFARYLQLDSFALPRSFLVLDRGFNDPLLVWQRVIHTLDDPKSELTYLDLVKAYHPKFPTDTMWKQLIAERHPFPAAAAIPYVDRLLKIGDYVDAEHAWSDLKGVGAVQDSSRADNMVFNGDFHQTPLNGGFDWRLQEQPFLSVQLAAGSACEESRCLHVSFPVPTNSDYEAAYQIVPVRPNQTYILSADMRSQEITSDSGPRLRVVDLECQTCLDAATAPAIGTTAWHKEELTFITGPATHLIRVSIWRPRSRVFPMEISGDFWLRAVTMRTEESARVTS